EQLPEFAMPVGDASVHFSPNSQLLAFVQRSSGVKLIDLTTRNVTTCPASVSPRSTPYFAPDGRLLGETANATDRCLWDLTNDRLLVRCQQLSGGFSEKASYWTINHYPFFSLFSIAEQLGAERVATWFLDVRRERRIFSTTTGEEVARIPWYDAWDLSPDGKTLVTFSQQEDCIALWDIPLRTALPIWLTWTTCALALLFTGVWWCLRRKGRS